MAFPRSYGPSVLLRLFRSVHEDNKSKALLALEVIDAQSIITDIKNRYADVLFRALHEECSANELSAAGIDVNITDTDGWIALLNAVLKKRMIRAMNDASVFHNIPDTDDWIALLTNVFKLKTFYELTDAVHDLNMADNDEWIASLHAVIERTTRELTAAGDDTVKVQREVGEVIDDGAVFMKHKFERFDNLYDFFKKRMTFASPVSNKKYTDKWVGFLDAVYEQKAVLVLIDAGADVNTTDKDGKTALFHAVSESANESLVRALIDAGARFNMIDKDKETALLYAFRNNNDIVVSALIDAGADINITDEDGKTALFHAVSESANEGVVRVLIDAGADVNITDRYGNTALFYAARQGGNDRVVHTLIKAGADVNVSSEYGYTALFDAVQQTDNENVVRALIDAGADVNISMNVKSTTPLIKAIEKNIHENGAICALIDAGANVNAADVTRQTPLLYAVQQSGNESVVRALIGAGADVNITDKDGKTAIFYAVQQSNEIVIRALVGSVDAKDKYGRTAHFYVNLEYLSALDCLLDDGGNQYLKMKDNCDVDILSFLLDKWVSSEDISFPCFKNGIVDVFTKQEMKRDVFKAIVNLLFLKSIGVFKKKYYKSHFWFRSDQLFLEEKLQALGEHFHEFIGNESLDRKLKMQTILKALENGFQDISETLELLAELDADPDTADSDGNTALHHVTRLPLWRVPYEKVMDLCSQLQRLRFGTQVNKRNHLRQTALLFCLSADMYQLTDEALSSAVKTLVQVCMFLVKQGSSMDETSRNGESVFHLMIKFFKRCLKVKDEALRKDVLREAMKILQLFPSWKVAKENAINKPDANLNSPLHLWASLSSSLDYVRSVSEENLTFKTLLEDILKYMLECEANVNARNESDETPLHLCQTWTAVKLLIDAGANVKTVDSTGSSLLLVAAKKGFHGNSDRFYPDVTDNPKAFWTTAVQLGLDPWAADKNDESVLGILVRSNAFVLAKALVEVACEQGFSKSKEYAVPLLNAICKDESTRSHWKTVLVKDILKSSQTTSSTPLRHCCRNIIDLLEKNLPFMQNKGSKVKKHASETPAAEGKTDTILHTAAKNSVHCEIANLLRSYGADIETPDSSGKSCLDIADGYPSLIDFLTKPLDNTAVPIVIPWTSTSTRYEDKMSKVARRQECKMLDQIWYHRDQIGTGSFGLIFAGINEKDGREVAIKRIEKLRMKRPEDKREIENLTVLIDCEQVVRYISFFEDEHFSHIVLELMEGNLEEYLKGSTTDASQATHLCKDVVMGLNFLHEQKILHRDLKPQNILYKFNPKRVCLKIADFGLSRIIDSMSTTVYGTCAGTKCWIAPEVLNSKPNEVDKNCFEPASDMFSCGLIIHYILSGQKHPFQPSDCTNKSEIIVAHETEDNLMKNNLEGWDNSLSPEATHLVKRMLDCNEKERPSAEEALEHPLFWSNEKKIDFLKAVGNQKEFECPRSKKTSPLTPVESDLETSFSTLDASGKCKWPWDDPTRAHMPDIYAGMTTGKGRKHYDTSSAVELVRFIRNIYEHYREKSFATPTPIEQLLFDDFVFLEYFPDLVMVAYKAVTAHGWDKKRDDIKSVMNKK